MRPEGKGRGPGRTAVVRLLQLALTALVTWFIVDRVGLGLRDLGGLEAGFWRPHGGWFALSCAALLAGYLLSARLWGVVVADLGGPRVPAAAAMRVFLVANLGRYVPGKVWQIAGLAVLARGLGVPPAVSTAAAVLGQAVALAGAALVGAAALVSVPDVTGGWSTAFLAVVAAVPAAMLVAPLRRGALRLWFRVARADGEVADPGTAVTLRWLLLYTLNWVVYAGSFVVLVKSLGLPGAPLETGSAFAAAYVLGYAMLFAPGGIGVREGFLVLFLSPTLGVAAAGGVSVVARVWTTAVELLPAGAFWVAHLVRGGNARD